MTWERRRNRKWCFMEPCFGLSWLAHTGTRYDNHQQPRYAMGDWIFRLRTSSMTVSRLVEPSYSKSNIWTFWFPQTHRNQLLIILRMLQERRNDSQTLRVGNCEPACWWVSEFQMFLGREENMGHHTLWDAPCPLQLASDSREVLSVMVVML